MYVPTAFRNEDLASLHGAIRAARLTNFVTVTADGLQATPLPFLLDAEAGQNGTLLGHIARANPQWKSPPTAEALAIFMGPDAYVSPSWYATKAETGKVVPTWNYSTIHAYGTVEFFDDPQRLLALVTRLTDLHEQPRAKPWSVSDAPEAYIQSQLRGIIGVRMTISRLEGKRKLSQNRTAEDRAGVAAGLAESPSAADRAVAALIPT